MDPWDSARLWVSAIGDPLAVTVFGAILIREHRRLRNALVDTIREEFAKLEAATKELTARLAEAIAATRSEP